MNEYVVYEHKNTINGKIYVGITNNIKRRWRNGGIEYKSKRKNSTPFWNAIQKYGWNNFKHIILINNLSFEEACEEEKRLIKELNSDSHENGYNVAPGGNGGVVYREHPRGMLGKHQTTYQIKHQREFLSHKENLPMRNVQWGVTHPHPKGMLGKHQTEHQKEVARTSGKNAFHGRKIDIIYPDGYVYSYPNISYACTCLGVSSNWIYRQLSRSKPYFLRQNLVQNVDNLRKLNGCIVQYSKEDTEIIS